MQLCHALSVNNTNIYLIRLINRIFVATVDFLNPKTILDVQEEDLRNTIYALQKHS